MGDKENYYRALTCRAFLLTHTIPFFPFKWFSKNVVCGSRFEQSILVW